jgi:hypothetical protein
MISFTGVGKQKNEPSGMCGVTHPCVLLSMLLLVGASLAPMELLK